MDDGRVWAAAFLASLLSVKTLEGSRGVVRRPSPTQGLSPALQAQLVSWIDGLAENQEEVDAAEGVPTKSFADYQRAAAGELAERVEADGAAFVIQSGALDEETFVLGQGWTEQELLASLRRLAG